MDKRIKIMAIGTALVVVVIVAMLGISITRRLSPSNEVMLLTDYYQVDDERVMIILQDEIHDKDGILEDGAVYIEYDTVVTYLNQRFYYDNNEKLLTYTTPTQIIRINMDSSEYRIIDKENKSLTYKVPIVKSLNDEIYLSLDFIKEYSNIEASFYSNPNRIIINYKWGEFLYTEVKKDTKLRFEPNIKSPILTELSAGDQLLYVDLDEPPKKGFSKVMTAEGVVGYVKNKSIKESFYTEIKSSYVEPEYTSLTRPYKINMVFHQVFGTNEAEKLETLIGATKGVNVVSPTWFSITDNTGSISSLANIEYVNKAHELGLEVWALIDDFNTEIDMKIVLGHTSSRQKLMEALTNAVREYDLDGINIDFEVILPEAGVHYIQFLRELSVMCRNEGIVLSVDNFVPPYKKHYDREEQGRIIDYFIVMAYDEYYAGSETAGPNSSIGFVTDAVRNTLDYVPREKTVIAIPFYTRLWKETEDGYVTREKDYAMTPAAQVLIDNNVVPKWNETYGCYYGEYEVDGVVYKMWQEEEKSIAEKLKVITEADVAGIAAWKLGLEKESVWNIIIEYLGK